MKEEMLSVGIDIGTSTTQLVFSKITIENTSGSAKVPQYKISDKNVIYRSKVYFTPLVSNSELDILKLIDIITNEYKYANIETSDVSTGAVIITGDTARKKNAEEVLKAISKFAGDFVVATAGPELEAIIAGKGSGSDKYSYDNICSIINLDIGGGTTNNVIFNDGSLKDVSCFDIGGRLIRFKDNTLEIEYIFDKIKQIAKDIGIDTTEGNIITLESIEKICEVMASVIIMILGLEKKNKHYDFLVTNSKDFKVTEQQNNISFSGGVGELIYNLPTSDFFKFNDIGIILATKIKNKLKNYNVNIVKPQETIGATVVGAGSHSTEISGSTIQFSDTSMFPIQNIPILKLSKYEEEHLKFSIEDVKKRIHWFFNMDSENEMGYIALSLLGESNMDFYKIQILADEIIIVMKEVIEKTGVLIVLVYYDFAKVLGQSLISRLRKDVKVIVIDIVKVDNGDYIDLGKPIGKGSVLPVIIKTLVFNY